MSADFRDQIQASLGAAFAIERELGSGGMSRVFLVTDAGLGRRIVVKLLPPDAAQTVSVDRFRREILFAARLPSTTAVSGVVTRALRH